MRKDGVLGSTVLPVRTEPARAQSSFRFQFDRKKQNESEPSLPPGIEPGKIPRISRLMALAIKYQGLIRDGIVMDYADLARLGLVTRARMTQIMGLLNLAPDIQEEILSLPRTVSGRDPIVERDVRDVCKTEMWERQRKVWKDLH